MIRTKPTVLTCQDFVNAEVFRKHDCCKKCHATGEDIYTSLFLDIPTMTVGQLRRDVGIRICCGHAGEVITSADLQHTLEVKQHEAFKSHTREEEMALMPSIPPFLRLPVLPPLSEPIC